MNTPVTIITTGRVTADLELKTSQNGRNTKFVQFSLAVNKGYGENNRPNYYKCLLFGEEAQRIIDAKVKKGSLIQIVGDLDLEEGEEVVIDNGHLVAWPDYMHYKIEKASNGWISSLTSGECIVCRFRGPGVVLIQTRKPEAFSEWLTKMMPAR